MPGTGAFLSDSSVLRWAAKGLLASLEPQLGFHKINEFYCPIKVILKRCSVFSWSVGGGAMSAGTFGAAVIRAQAPPARSVTADTANRPAVSVVSQKSLVFSAKILPFVLRRR